MCTSLQFSCGLLKPAHCNFAITTAPGGAVLSWKYRNHRHSRRCAEGKKLQLCVAVTCSHKFVNLLTKNLLVWCFDDFQKMTIFDAKDNRVNSTDIFGSKFAELAIIFPTSMDGFQVWIHKFGQRPNQGWRRLWSVVVWNEIVKLIAGINFSNFVPTQKSFGPDGSCPQVHS